MPTTAVYMRVSSEDQAERHSTAAQRAVIGAWLDAQGTRWEDVRTFEDEGFTGREMHKAPAFGELQDAIEAGEIDRVVVYDMTRLGRKALTLMGFIEDCDERGVPIWCVHSDTGPLDLTTAEGWFRVALNAVLAEFESRRTGDRTKAGHRARRRRGTPNGGNRRMTPEDIRRALETSAQGLHHGQVAELVGVNRSSISRLLQQHAVALEAAQGTPPEAIAKARGWPVSKVEEAVLRMRTAGVLA